MLRQDIVPSDTRGLEEANCRFRSEADLCGALFNVRGEPIADLPAATFTCARQCEAPVTDRIVPCVVQSATVFVGVRRLQQSHGACLTTNTSFPRKCRVWLTWCAAAASESGKRVTSGTRMTPASNSATRRSRCNLSRTTLGRSACTSPRSGFGACEPEAMKAARPPGFSTANARCAVTANRVERGIASRRSFCEVLRWAGRVK